MDGLRVWLLGGFRVCVGAREIPDERWRLRKSRALVKLLALAPGRRMHREEVIEHLWPDLSPEAAENQLRKALHEARRTLDPDPAATFTHILSGPLLALAPRTWVDLDAYEAAAAEARRTRSPVAYERAVAGYGGDLLPEDRYEDWAGLRRETVRADFVALLVEWARLLEARADLDRAAMALRHAVTLDPTSEEARVGLMRVHALAGRRHEALQEYQRLCQVLRQELGTAPVASTQHLYEQLRAGQTPDGDLDADLWEQVGDLRLLSGDTAGAGTAFERALRTGQRPGTPAWARLHRKAAEAWLSGQQPQLATPHVRAVQELTGTDAAERARRLAVEAAWLCQTGHPEQAQAAAEAAVRTARRSGVPDAVALAHEVLAIVLHMRGAWREGIHAEIERLRAGADATSGLATVSEIHCCIGQYHLYGDGLSDSVEDYARRTLDLAITHRARRAEAFAWCLLGESLLLQGRWEESGACLERSTELYTEFGPSSGGLAWHRLAELAAYRGDSGTAQTFLRRAVSIATVSPLAQHLWGRVFSVAALDAAESDDPYAVIRASRSAAAAAARYGDCASCGVLLNPLAAAACAQVGDEAAAEAYAQAARQVAARFTSSAWRAMAESAQGALLSARGDSSAARARHLAAAELYDRARQPFWAARARLDAAVTGRTDGGVDTALADQARAAFEQLGALRALARARAASAERSSAERAPIETAASMDELRVPAGPRRPFAEVG